MNVTVVDRAAMNAQWGHGLFRVITRTVKVSDRCPTCGGPRGEPRRVAYYEDGEHYTVDRWTNPCGHVDKYGAILAESEGDSR